MEKSEIECSLIYSNENIEKEQDINKLVKELSELFKGLDELLIRTIVLAANGDMILAYNSLIFYTEGWEIYKQERLPLGISVRALMSGKSLEEGKY